MALQYVTNYLLPTLDTITDGTIDRVQQYVIDSSVELFDQSNSLSPSGTSSISENNIYSNDYQDDKGSYTSSTQFELSLSQLSISSSSPSSNSHSNLNSDEELKESPLPNLLNIPVDLKMYMDHYPDVYNLVQNNIDLISNECSDLEKYMNSDFGIFSVMKEVLLLPPTDDNFNQNLEMIYEMTEILEQKIKEMETATENLVRTQETFQNILETFNSTSL